MTAAQPDEHDKGNKPDKPPHPFRIQIDRVHYEVMQDAITGAELRNVPPTPIGPERDLFEVVPGDSDRKIETTDVVEIRNGKRFFTAPSTINPGADKYLA